MYIRKNTTGGGGHDKSSKTNSDYVPEYTTGEFFNLFTGTRISASNPVMCPREKVRIQILNPEVLDPFYNNSQGGNYSYNHLISDKDDLRNIGTFEIPEASEAPDGEYIVNVRYTNDRTNESVESQVKFRVKR